MIHIIYEADYMTTLIGLDLNIWVATTQNADFTFFDNCTRIALGITN